MAKKKSVVKMAVFSSLASTYGHFIQNLKQKIRSSQYENDYKISTLTQYLRSNTSYLLRSNNKLIVPFALQKMYINFPQHDYQLFIELSEDKSCINITNTRNEILMTLYTKNSMLNIDTQSIEPVSI